MPLQGAAGDARHHHLVNHGVTLLHGEVGLCGGSEVYLLYDGLMAHIAHLQSDVLGGQLLETVATVGVGHGGLAQFGYVEGDPDERFTVGGVGHPAREMGEPGSCGQGRFGLYPCAQAACQAHQDGM